MLRSSQVQHTSIEVLNQATPLAARNYQCGLVSTYLMITRALDKRQEIDALIQVLDVSQAEKRGPLEDRLSGDWLILSETAYILTPLEACLRSYDEISKQG